MAFGFGRKDAGGSAPPPAAARLDGREWVDRHLARNDRPGSMEFAQALGLKLFDSAYNAMKDERGVRIEAIVAMLASVGGFFCILPVMRALRAEGLAPPDIGMVTVKGHDGRLYQFGDAPNRLLCEHPMSLISLVFGAAHQHGAAVSVDLMNSEMQHVVNVVGTPDYMTLDLPSHLQVDTPDVWLRHSLPFVLDSISAAFVADLERQGMAIPADLPASSKLPPDFLLARIVAFAIQQSIDVGHQSLDPTMLANVAMQCAMRTAKIDPNWLD